MKKAKKINRFKLTPEADKMIAEHIKNLPQFQRKNNDGSLMFRIMTKTLKGKDLPAGTKLKDDAKIDENKMYVHRFLEPVMVNHVVNLNSIYQVDGENGVKTYVKFFMDIHEENLRLKQEADKLKKEKEVNKTNNENVLKIVKGDA